MRSPGRPRVNQRDAKQAFWARIAAGASSEDAALASAVSQPVGTRWFREAGGMAPISMVTLSGRYLSFDEREELALLNAQRLSIREITRRVERSPSTISRELRRYVQDRLAGAVADARGLPIQGPQVAWKGRRHGRRADRRWGKCWSPQQISRRLPIDFPDDARMRISHEAIYQALYVQGRGALRRELSACLRTGRALRVPRARTRQRGKSFITPEVMISQRRAEVADRAVPGHWEGDMIIGLNSSAIGTLVERTTRFTMLLHLPRMEGHIPGAGIKNGPALAGRGAKAVRDAIAKKIQMLPAHLRRSLTWDQGAELAQHAQLRIDTGLEVYFCDPQCPWQRGTNENTNGLLRQYFPKGTDISRYSERELDAVAITLNTRPRETLGWRTPAEALNKILRRRTKTTSHSALSSAF
jgi:IS30 family transposase